MADEEQATEEKSAPPAQESRNGVTRPRPNTKTGRVWEIADEISESTGAPAKRADVLEQYESEGGNSATGATQYGRWKKFHGLSGQKKKAAPEDEAAVEE